MAHRVESMFSGEGVVPWHGLGKVVDSCLTANEAIAAANLNWEVHKVPLYAADGTASKIIKTPLPDAFGIQRATDKKILGVVGAQYRPLQNHEAFGFLDDVVTRKEAMFVTAGSLDGGRCIWLLVKLPGDLVVRRGRRSDPIQKYLLLTNRHDGFGSAAIKFTPIRVVCWNTLSQALRGGALQLRHTPSVALRVRKAHETLGITSRFYEGFKEKADLLMRREMKEAAVREYLNRCLQASPTTQGPANPAGKEPRSLALALQLHEAGRGAEIARGTVWGAYNAITELVDHHLGYHSPNNRLRNMWLEGNGQVIKVRAFEEALKLV